MRFEFIDLQKKAYPVKLLCHVLRVSYSGYFSWRKRANSNKQKDDLLKSLVIEIQRKHRNSCGSRRIAAKLTESGIKTGRYNKVAKLMKQVGASFIPARKFKVTTDSKHNFPVSPNLVARNFKVKQPDKVWVSDITYLRANECWSYLAVIIDLANREVVEVAIKSRITQELIIEALKIVVRNKSPEP